MHISEGVLSAPVLIGGAAAAAAGVAVGLRKMDYDRIPQVAVLSSAFFVASLVHFPIPGGTSAHLLLNGLVGVVLGWAAFPALLVALVLQAALFQHGGLTTLGVNTVIMAGPAVAVYYLFNAASRWGRDVFASASGFLAGAAGVLFSALCALAALAAGGQALTVVGAMMLVASLPVMAVEGLVTASVVAFLRRTRPDLLVAPVLENPVA